MQFIDPEDISKYPQALIIDVRDSDYNVEGHLRRSINIQISQLREQENLMKIEQHNTIICFCQMSKQRGPYAAYLIGLYTPKRRFTLLAMDTQISISLYQMSVKRVLQIKLTSEIKTCENNIKFQQMITYQTQYGKISRKDSWIHSRIYSGKLESQYMITIPVQIF
ncbi:Rhodanese_domain-containing protein [Hexamita inflata]|uniref:Rhodanese_domain-containing protein n=1 Tax=Hexamita inflata TaxID=28002 RepID=A0ABP1GEG0_9EUKA